jgi:CHASE1-domain containing sensor protein
MYAWAPILLFLVGLLVVAGLAYYAYQRKLERQRELRSVAYGQRLDFSIDDPFDPG